MRINFQYFLLLFINLALFAEATYDPNNSFSRLARLACFKSGSEPKAELPAMMFAPTPELPKMPETPLE